MYGTSIIALFATSFLATTSHAGPLLPRADPIVVYPSFTSQYNAKTGAVTFNTTSGLVSRNPQNGGADISTLVTFALDTKYSTNKCQLVFDLTDSKSSVSGTGKAQLYSALAPAYTSASSWPSGNLRDQDLGSIVVVKGKRATWDATAGGLLAGSNGTFPCSDIAGAIFGGEIVPRGDTVEIKWPTLVDGIKILVT
ncbi:hypothetical protein LTR84_006031 [Exophiala bonariae]|uniref:Ubiquitin 3 binding protein But2 C-terminal domain-containing protein n=1 Tax=Exophiala bonariae TaxID=1690606 RepID=A0AAV9N4W9_9EURO|nr:hypothetical protein LTR84_006031 [Exophiala bonariae]